MKSVKGSIITKWLLLLFLILPFCTPTTDTITPSQSIRDGDVLVSSGKSFALGFFSPDNSTTRRYLGIWFYKVPEQTVVWVANRNSPINGTSGTLSVDQHGNLVILENNESGGVPVWSTNVSASAVTNNSMAQLLDTGNLVLVQQDSKRVLWQSFDYPTDTLIPLMKLGLDRRTGFSRFLSSWKSEYDPGIGDISLRIDPVGYPQLFLYKGSLPRWRGGPWTGLRWSGVPEMTNTYYIFSIIFVNNVDEVSIWDGIKSNASNAGPIFTRMIVNESGYIQRSTWNDHDHRWIAYLSAPKELCDNYGECGANGNCDPYNDPGEFFCNCLPGYEPKSPRDWYMRDGSGGCIGKAGSSTCRSGEGFVMLARVKVPDTSVARADMGLSLKQCEQECLGNCSCMAFASADERGIGCLMWFGDLVDTRSYSSVGQDLFVRVDAAELAKYQKSKGPLAKRGIQAILVVSIAMTSFLILFLVYWLVKRKRKAENEAIFSNSANLGHSPLVKEHYEIGSPADLPLYDLSTIAAATNNFSTANKLGEGGFGAVYKGILQDGKEIAVKRLSKNSGQGTEEFMTEVALIAKLQHRNLVRILGCCIKNQEKMLVYEYLPNKSLDSVIFDENKRSQLDWPMRFNIICGIARGILYLHQDSRLRIIHRDLKASNVLLDALMNPKISDFGMARIVGGDQIEANTRRIVGTYGYMSPEYAMQGLFSVKSDVYSFGVLLLEIITGHKNSIFYGECTCSNLVGYVWEKWREGTAMEIVDLSLAGSYSEHEVFRCIQIGLLCVQEAAVDRPTMSTVIFMVSNDNILPSPKQPAFILKGSYNSGDPSTNKGASTVNDVTITMLEVR